MTEGPTKDDANSIAVKYGVDELRRMFDAAPKLGVPPQVNDHAADAEPDGWPDDGAPPIGLPSAGINGRSDGGLGEALEDIAPFETFDASEWEDQPIEPRRWVVHNRIPAGEAGIMAGDGGTGKTKLALQLGVAIAAELPDWVNGIIEARGPVIVFSAEEKLREMHRRVADILAHRGLSFRDLKNRLHFIVDQNDVILGKVEDGIVGPTLALHRLEKTVAAIRPALVMIENAADVFAGNEIDRLNVTRFVRGLLGGLTKPSDAAMMLIQHPSVGGLQDGTGRSGSTAWNNAGRWRLNFTALKPQGDDGADDGLRQLHVIKSNYGPIGEKVRLKWERGVFVPEGTASTPERAAVEGAIDAAFLRCLRVKTSQGIAVSPSPRSDAYAPKVFEPMREAEGHKARAFQLAMERLLSAKRITVVQDGPPSRRRQKIEENTA
jgi:RecA-family ATPase